MRYKVTLLLQLNINIEEIEKMEIEIREIRLDQVMKGQK